MRDRGLLKQALESGKTSSKKAKSKVGTPSGSKHGSPVPSRNVSDDESEMSEGTQWSVNSIDDLLTDDVDPDTNSDVWIADLYQRIEQIVDRKRSSGSGREDTLRGFAYDLTRHYSKNEIRAKMPELLPAVLKSVKSGTERETVLALKAIALMLITDQSDTIYDAVSGPIKSSITDSHQRAVQIAAIHALGIATFYGGATVEETEEVMEFLLEIISSDGGFVEAQDDAEIVIAALEEWAFLATQLDDLEEITEVAMDTFVDQLESSDAGVQIAAGEAIALCYEMSFTEAESDDEMPDDEGEDEESNGHGPRMIKRYTVYRNQHQLVQTLENLTRLSTKRLSKKDRKSLHTVFADVLLTIEKPTRGPRYSTALDPISGRELGSRLKIAVHGGGRMVINTWEKLHRLSGLKRTLQAGFLVHYEHNPVVFDSLPVIIEHDRD